MPLPISLNAPPSRATAPDTFVVDMDYWWANDLPGLVAAINALNANDWFSILGTVSQSGGVPTGAIFEKGSNANGDYVRMASGLQICTHTLTVASVTEADGALFRSSDTIWTFPASFIDTPVAVGSGSAGVEWNTAYAANAVAGAARIYRATSIATPRNVKIAAIGDWF